MDQVRLKNIKTKISIADILIYFAAGILGILTVWPFIFIFSMSVSDPAEAVRQSVWLFPKGFHLDAYIRVFQNSFLWISYRNTIFYVASGTVLNCIMSVLAAYPLSRKKLYGRRLLVKFIIIPMYFTGGLIPFFILITKLGLYDNFLVMILPYMVTIWNIILVRTFFMGIPEALHESAVIDGANDLLILSKIIVPLSKSILAVIALYSAVGIWNSWFYAMIFLPNRNLHPLQLFLAKLLVFEAPNITNANQEMLELLRQQQSTVLQMKYAVIMFATVPIMCMYPFLQKYFIKGTLIGSLKE